MKLTVKKILNQRRFSRKRKDGTSRIVRDSYSNHKLGWFEMRRKVLERDGHSCAAVIGKDQFGRPIKCGCKTGLEIHHRVPLSKGGKTTMANLITLCRSCHDSRHLHLKRGG